MVNVTGAGGTVGSRRVKDAKPDGYTFLQIHGSLFATKAKMFWIFKYVVNNLC